MSEVYMWVYYNARIKEAQLGHLFAQNTWDIFQCFYRFIPVNLFPFFKDSSTQGEISWKLYRASVCDMKKHTFLFAILSQVLQFTLQTSWYGMTKNISGKLPDPFGLRRGSSYYWGCHTLTQVLKNTEKTYVVAYCES